MVIQSRLISTRSIPFPSWDKKNERDKSNSHSVIMIYSMRFVCQTFVCVLFLSLWGMRDASEIRTKHQSWAQFNCGDYRLWLSHAAFEKTIYFTFDSSGLYLPFRRWIQLIVDHLLTANKIPIEDARFDGCMREGYKLMKAIKGDLLFNEYGNINNEWIKLGIGFK